jgi:hypothetical protein
MPDMERRDQSPFTTFQARLLTVSGLACGLAMAGLLVYLVLFR